MAVVHRSLHIVHHILTYPGSFSLFLYLMRVFGRLILAEKGAIPDTLFQKAE